MAGAETRQGLIRRQRVAPAKAELAKRMRREMTWSETALWQRLRAHRLAGMHFRRQQPIDGFVVDFYCHAAALVVEVDGPVHDGQESQDDERTRILEARGLRVLRVRNEDVETDIERVVRQILDACGNPTPPQSLPREERC